MVFQQDRTLFGNFYPEIFVDIQVLVEVEFAVRQEFFVGSERGIQRTVVFLRHHKLTLCSESLVDHRPVLFEHEGEHYHNHEDYRKRTGQTSV